MMVKRKLDGAVDESSADQRFINPERLYMTCEKSGGLHLSGTKSYGKQAGSLADEI